MRWKEAAVTMKDGTVLFTRTAGKGLPLLMIHGAACDSAFFDELGLLLAAQFQVILYDRRGYGRSSENTLCPEGAETYFSLQAADAEQVLSSLAPGRRSIVLGCSCGAFVAAYLAAEHSCQVSRLLLHEPPLYSVLPADGESRLSLNKIVDAVKKEQYERALHRFLLFLDASTAADTKPLTPEAEAAFAHNGRNFIQREFCYVLDRHLCLPSAYRTDASVLLGEETAPATLGEVVRQVAEQLCLPLRIVPGGHNAAREIPEIFAAALLRELAEGGLKQ